MSLLNALMSQSNAQCAAYDATKELGIEGVLGTDCEPVATRSNGGSLEFLTSPVEAVLAARSRAMVFQNEQSRRRIEQVDTDLRLDRVVFAHCNDGSMNWIVPPDEFEETQAALDAQRDAKKSKLVKTWQK